MEDQGRVEAEVRYRGSREVEVWRLRPLQEAWHQQTQTQGQAAWSQESGSGVAWRINILTVDFRLAFACHNHSIYKMKSVSGSLASWLTDLVSCQTTDLKLMIFGIWTTFWSVKGKKCFKKFLKKVDRAPKFVYFSDSFLQPGKLCYTRCKTRRSTRNSLLRDGRQFRLCRSAIASRLCPLTKKKTHMPNELERNHAIVISMKNIFGILSPFECESIPKYSWLGMACFRSNFAWHMRFYFVRG